MKGRAVVDRDAYLGEIPVVPLAERRLHLGPFDSGRTLATFLCAAILGAIVAAATSAVVWLPFLGAGALLAFVRLEGQPLDEYALGYCRYGLRTRLGGAPGRDYQPRGPPHRSDEGIRARGVPVAYLPPEELQRLFEGWRAALVALDTPVAIQVSAERFSPVPYLPARGSMTAPDHAAQRSYRELVRLLVGSRLRRKVDLRVGRDGGDHETAVVGLLEALQRLGVPAERVQRDCLP